MAPIGGSFQLSRVRDTSGRGDFLPRLRRLCAPCSVRAGARGLPLGAGAALLRCLASAARGLLVSAAWVRSVRAGLCSLAAFSGRYLCRPRQKRMRAARTSVVLDSYVPIWFGRVGRAPRGPCRVGTCVWAGQGPSCAWVGGRLLGGCSRSAWRGARLLVAVSGGCAWAFFRSAAMGRRTDCDGLSP